MNGDRRQLIGYLKDYSVKTDEVFELASGQKTNTYIDVKQTMLYGPAMCNLAGLLRDYAAMFGRWDFVAGVPMGGAYLATMAALMANMHGGKISVVMIREKPKDHGTQKLIEVPPPVDFATRRVILFEDVVTTGNSAIKAAELLEAEGFRVGGIVAVVDRRADTSETTLGAFGFRAIVDFEELIV
jgi:orotate phosphoribosyltransferase